MRMLAFAAIALLPALVRADVSVRRAPSKPAETRPKLCVQLFTAAAETSSRDVEWQASISVTPQKQTTVRESRLSVRDASGREVAHADAAFVGPERPWSIGLGMSSNGGPSLPALPPGEYRAVWTVDGFESAPARFTLGPAPPAPLTVEWRGCTCGAPLVAHLYNAGPKNIDLLESLEKSVLIVDGKRYQRQGIEWDGGTNLPPRRSWSTGLWLAEYGVTLGPGPHAIELELAGARTRVENASLDCGK